MATEELRNLRSDASSTTSYASIGIGVAIAFLLTVWPKAPLWFSFKLTDDVLVRAANFGWVLGACLLFARTLISKGSAPVAVGLVLWAVFALLDSLVAGISRVTMIGMGGFAFLMMYSSVLMIAGGLRLLFVCLVNSPGITSLDGFDVVGCLAVILMGGHRWYALISEPVWI